MKAYNLWNSFTSFFLFQSVYFCPIKLIKVLSHRIIFFPFDWLARFSNRLSFKHFGVLEIWSFFFHKISSRFYRYLILIHKLHSNSLEKWQPEMQKAISQPKILLRLISCILLISLVYCLDGSGSGLRKRPMTTALLTKRKLYFVDGSLTRP